MAIRIMLGGIQNRSFGTHTSRAAGSVSSFPETWLCCLITSCVVRLRCGSSSCCSWIILVMESTILKVIFLAAASCAFLNFEHMPVAAGVYFLKGEENIRDDSD
ncbi:hypothetical protein Salat_2024800 [Sesamum alatum]|uniref:Uncharacterized protein n=1 Tax=Sesamum alatum TaxID=300844 RepID=A0AAE1XZ43_9LAMI|nr:hypothetical protein Salat_2024800 [Sesamum alatum]